MKRALALVLSVTPLFAGCSLLSADPIPPSPALAGVSAQNAAWESEIKRTPDGAAFTPLVEARAAVDRARAQQQVEAYDADSLQQAEAALERAQTGWQPLADHDERPPAMLAEIAQDAHRAQRLAEIARYTAAREINLKQINKQMAARSGQQAASGNRPTAAGLAGAGDGLIGQRVVPDRLGDIAFENGTARLTAPSRAVVARLAALMRNHSNYGVAIFGHTDNVAPRDSTLQRFVNANPGLEEQAPTRTKKVRAFNLALSSARARSVGRALVKDGVPARRIGARGFGDTRPVASNDSVEGRRANRRIEAVIVPGPDSQAAQRVRDSGS